MNETLASLIRSGPLSHIDNVQVRIIRSPKRDATDGRKTQKKLAIDYRKVASLFHLSRVVEVNDDFKVYEWKYHDVKRGICYKIYGNCITISLSRRVWGYDDSGVSYYQSMLDGMCFLFQEGIIKSNGANLRQKARYYLIARGSVVIEHAIDVSLSPKARLEGTDATSKRYARVQGKITRFEVLIKDMVSHLRIPLKQTSNLALMESLYEVILRKHTNNFTKRTTTLELSAILGVPVRTDTPRAKKAQCAKALPGILLGRELGSLTTTSQRQVLAGLDHQNVI